MKFDGAKLRYDLIPFEALEQIVAVITYGAEKYAPENWKEEVEPARWMAAAYRHLTAVSMGEDMDDDTGLPHLAHAACCILFMLWQLGDKLPKTFDFSAVAEQFAGERAKHSVKCTNCLGTGYAIFGPGGRNSIKCVTCNGTGVV